MTKRESHNLSRSNTQQWSLGTGPGKCLLATTYELLQIKEGRHCLSKMGRSLKCWGPSGGEEVLAGLPISRTSFKLLLSSSCPRGSQGPGCVVGRGQSQWSPSLVFPDPDALRSFPLQDPNRQRQIGMASRSCFRFLKTDVLRQQRKPSHSHT